MRIPTTLRVALLSALLALAANLAVIGFIHWRTYDDSAEALRQQVMEEASVLDDVYASGGRAALDKAVADTLASGDPQLLGSAMAPRPARRRGSDAVSTAPARSGCAASRGRPKAPICFARPAANGC
jgi:hypothetical protein